MAAKKRDDDEHEPVIRDKRRIDPETGEARVVDESPLADDGAPTDAESVDDLIAAEDADVEVSESGAGLSDDQSLDADIDHILSEAGQREIEEYRDRAARAEAELANFRTRVERDRAANREAVIADVIRSLLPAIDDLDRAAAHGDLEGSPLELVAQKLRQAFERYGLTSVGVVGEPFDPAFHEAIVQLPSAEATTQTVADVIEGGYALGDRLVRPAKVAVSVPQG
ncbi:MAG: nucleotide exchange factor GrpE [Microcella sp.]|uniref:nucleotide exchange factor GrpE n=1 Tax=Microcella sp. TaxID=1913979 RepID=UPI0024C5F054|nr:nucleotide exchange factor GrpE [Microcella sp.]UYN82981.1 MAG: nucleotide exchange factor GrpE [Microcella sp.]